MARTAQPNIVTADQLLAFVSTAQPAAAPQSLGVTNFIADVSAGVVDRTGKIVGAFAASAGNFSEHFKLERTVQQARSKARLQAAAIEAANRINAALGQ